VDDYLVRLEPDARTCFERIRDLAVQLVPLAEQGTSYGVPALMYAGKPLIGFHAAARHLSIYPYSSTVIDAVRDRLTGLAPSKGSIRFTAAEPLPDDVVRDVVRLRASEIRPPG
jgi:uncharacterized protein YdhG (YjbR/CyaY superfamily)